MFPTRETSVAEVFAHALDDDGTVTITGASVDYDDVHDGVHYHADLIEAARAEWNRRLEVMREAAEAVALRAMLADEHARGGDPRAWGLDWAEKVAEYATAREAWFAAGEILQALYAKRDQDAAFATYEFVAPPAPGDAIDPAWSRGCGQRRSASQLDCTSHVGDYHVAASTTEVCEVWAR